MSKGSRELGPHPKPGDQLGRFQLGETVGSGGMASVYKATDDRSEEVAVKVLNPARVLPEEVKRFTREFKALSRMDHPNIVRVIDSGVHEGYPWIAMEYVDGDDLDAKIEAFKSDPSPDRFDEIESILRGLCEGLAYVHEIGLIHRDIKPSNVLLTRDGRPKLSDFGVVKDPNSTGTQLTMAGRLVGTVAFMAPELIAAEPVDARTDLYALGAVLYMLLTFRRPIEASSIAGYLARHLTEVPDPPREVDPDIPSRLDRICQRLLLKDPAHRYPSARSVLNALDSDEDTQPHPVRGRDAEINTFSERLATLREGGGGVIGITGVPGSGTSTLLGCLVDHARSHGLTTVTADAAEGEVLPQLLASAGLRPADHAATTRPKLLSERLAQAPTVLAVDHLHLATREERDGLALLFRELVTLEGRPVLWVFSISGSDGGLDGVISGASTGIPAEVLTLGPLDKKSTMAIVRDRGLQGSLAPALGRRLFQDYGGLPGAILQQIERLVEAEWLVEEAPGVIRNERSLDDLRSLELPLPKQLEEQVLATIEPLSEDEKTITQLLALLGRPANASVLQRATGDPDIGFIADGLVSKGILSRDEDEHQELLVLANPAARRVIRANLHNADRRRLHGDIAKALGSRRRSASLEVASHMLAAGDPHQAYPILIRGARRAARAGQYGDVIEICDRAESVRTECEAKLEFDEASRLRRWLFMLRGEALLARRRWSEAVEPLERAVAAARLEPDGASLARCLSSLGRAHYRLGRFAQAMPLLEEALELTDPGAPERASATRALADILLRDGKVSESETHWQEALDIAMEIMSNDSEARARRGLAHVRAIQGRLPESAEFLDQADDLLHPAGDARVRAGVLARSIELDIVAGRFSNAMHRADVLINLCRRQEMPERLAEAWALFAEASWYAGLVEEARQYTRKGTMFVKGYGASAWAPALRLARLWCNLGSVDEAVSVLPGSDAVPGSSIDDPPAQVAALRARIAQMQDRIPSARDLANWALTRKPALLAVRSCLVALDAGEALLRTRHSESARKAAKRGLTLLKGAGADGLRLELLLLMHRASPDERVQDAAAQVARRMYQGLPPRAAKSFSNRSEVAAALARIR